jgi:hypothetical protein
VTNILTKNGYPSHLIKKYVYSCFENGKVSNESLVSSKIYVSVTNIPNITSKLRKIVGKYNNEIVLAPKNTVLVKNIHTKVKDKVDKWKKSNLVYSIKCECGTSYVGRTDKQYLGTRILQHSNDCKNLLSLAEKCCVDDSINIKDKAREKINNSNDANKILLGKLLKNIEKSGLTSHTATTKHQFIFNETKILSNNTNRFKNSIMEMIHIKQSDNINKQTETNFLSPTYYGILNILKNQKQAYTKKRKKLVTIIPGNMETVPRDLAISDNTT